MTSAPTLRSARSAAVGGPGSSRVLTVLLTSAAYFMVRMPRLAWNSRTIACLLPKASVMRVPRSTA